MTRHIPTLLAALAIVPIAPATGQTCTEPHYRWSEKVDTAVPASCIIVEIPAPAFGNIYKQARDQLTGLVDTTHLGSGGDLNTPVQVTFTGAAFFDG